MSQSQSVPHAQSVARAAEHKVEQILRWPDHVLTVLSLCVLAVVLVQMMVPILPIIHFDVDPRSESAGTAITVMGPTASAWISVIGMGLSALVMIFHHLAGRKIAWTSCILAMIGMGFCWYHMGDNVQSMHRSMLWAGAMAIALAGRHLAEHERLRRLAVASLLAMLIPMAFGSIIFVLIEHPATVKMFQENEEAFLSARGWAKGSAQHQLYVRRLMFNDATGSFGLSNVYGSILASLTLLGVIVSGHVARQWRATWSIVPGAAVILGLAAIYLTHSKGAVAVLVAGGILCIACWWISRTTERSRLTLPILALLLIAGASLAVVARYEFGGIPKTDKGERSLLFRFQYWQGATRVAGHMSTDTLFWGLGPGQFKQAYVIYKDPLNPEEVTSTHNVFMDQVLSLGIGGLCWSLLLVGWVCKGGQLAGEELTAVPDPHALLAPKGVKDKTIIVVCALALMLFGWRFAVQSIALLTPESLLGFTGGAIGFIVLTSVLISEGWLTDSATRAGLFVAASALLIHNQIEMTFFHDGACIVAMFIVALAGAGHLHRGRDKTEPNEKPFVFRLVLPAAMIALMVMTVTRGAKPMTVFQGHLANAAAQLQFSHAQNQAGQNGSDAFLNAIGYLEQANATIPNSPKAWHWRIQLLAELAQGQHRIGQISRANQMFTHAEALSAKAMEACPKNLSIMRQKANLQLLAARWFDEPGRKFNAISAWSEIILLNPYGITDHMALADLYWEVGRVTEAKTMYEKTIKLSDQAYLDPGKQLSEKDRDRCMTRIRQASEKVQAGS
ncbi:MAG: O-antigen ligase family protein [Phycisphaeraceae bacterium JB051]